ncbi:MAG: large-conductance mechanosensitive channel protein MscL [Acholeplasma sp.]|nr:large-conductance mechanosensitive channel protein MscL [Acholeplasma sp.]
MRKRNKLVDPKEATKGFWKGFKDFIAKGNVVDLAVGVIIGAAFGKIVSSLVNDIIMPPIGLLINDVDFKDLSIVLRAEELNSAGEVIKNAVTINYGSFVMTIIEFLIIAFTIYASLTLVIRRKEFIEKLEAEEKAKLASEEPKEEPVVEVSEEVLLLREIRDSLKNKE